LQIYEARLLPNGNCVLALGEAGLRLITRDGRTVAQFDEPADHLVASNTGAKIIALSRRGGTWTLSKLDVASRKMMKWCHAEIDRFVPTYEASAWYVTRGTDLYAIDVASHRLDALWKIPDLGVFLGPLSSRSGQLNLLTQNEGVIWHWTYRLPDLKLVQKIDRSPFVTKETIGEIRLCGSESGVVDYSSVVPPGGNQIQYTSGNGAWTEVLSLQADEQLLSDPVTVEGWLAICVGSPTATRICVYSHPKISGLRLRIEITMEGQCRPCVRIDGSILTIADDLGRLRAYELTYGEQIGNLNL
jgi:hypothetical protein